MARYWLGVVQREHVERGVALGIAQINHGSKAGVSRLAPGDGFAYYSPKTSYPDGEPLRAFTAIGIVDEGDPWQGDDPSTGSGRRGDFHPWRRRVSYADDVTAAPIAPLKEELDFVRENPNWGYALRRGLIELSEHDFRVIAHAMGADSLAG